MPCLDAEVIAELRDILGEDLNAVASEFAEQLTEQLDLLGTKLQAEDWPEVARIAHLLKGSAGNLGASALAAQLLLLEQAARAGDGGAAPGAYAAVADLSAACLAELAEQGLLAQ